MAKTFPIFVLLALAVPCVVFAQTATTPNDTAIVSLNATSLIPRAAISVSPPAQTVMVGSTFNVSIYLNSEHNSVNTLNLTVDFPPDKLQIVNPSASGTSLIQLWLQPPTYSNTVGDVQFVGVIPNGVMTSGSLVTTITFKAIAAGTADVTITPDSSVLANDGLGTPMDTEFDRGIYTITPQPPAGPVVFSPLIPSLQIGITTTIRSSTGKQVRARWNLPTRLIAIPTPSPGTPRPPPPERRPHTTMSEMDCGTSI